MGNPKSPHFRTSKLGKTFQAGQGKILKPDSTNKTPNMKTDLASGSLGEKTLLKHLSSDFKQTNSRSNDLENAVTGVKVEVKNESYTHKRIAIEQYSDQELKTVGGIHKAKRDGCKYIVHYFEKTNVVVIFEVDKLISFLGNADSFDYKFNNLKDCIPFAKTNRYNAEGKEVPRPWVTKGYAVPLSFFPKDSYHLVKLTSTTKLDELLK